MFTIMFLSNATNIEQLIGQIYDKGLLLQHKYIFRNANKK